jgi:hypothetical protein
MSNQDDAQSKFVTGLLLATGQLRFVEGAPFLNVQYLESVMRECVSKGVSLEDSLKIIITAAKAEKESLTGENFLDLISRAFGINATP